MHQIQYHTLLYLVSHLRPTPGRPTRTLNGPINRPARQCLGNASTATGDGQRPFPFNLLCLPHRNAFVENRIIIVFDASPKLCKNYCPSRDYKITSDLLRIQLPCMKLLSVNRTTFVPINRWHPSCDLGRSKLKWKSVKVQSDCHPGCR